MKAELFAIPVKPGKLAAYKKFAAEIIGPRKAEYQDLLRRYGLKTAKVWLHNIAGRDYVMVFHDIEANAAELFKGWSSSPYPFDQWFNEQCLSVYDIESFDNMLVQPELLYEIDSKETEHGST